jgi:Domain of unknown function (DUF4169)
LTDIVNLRLERKRKRRAGKDAAADASRRAHGRTKDEKTQAERLHALDAKRLEGHRREQGRDDT